MTSLGIDRFTGKPLSGWDHTVQSIGVILTTAVGERVQRRTFGSRIGDMIDKPQNDENILGLYMAVAEALEPRVVDGAQLGEPRFVLTSLYFKPGPDGAVTLDIWGDEYPNGHLGDFTARNRGRHVTLPIGAFF